MYNNNIHAPAPWYRETKIYIKAMWRLLHRVLYIYSPINVHIFFMKES